MAATRALRHNHTRSVKTIERAIYCDVLSKTLLRLAYYRQRALKTGNYACKITGGRTLINKTKLKIFFERLKRLSEENKPYVICKKHGLLAKHDLDPKKLNDLKKSFADAKTINGLTLCEIEEIFTVGAPLKEFDSPCAAEVRSAVIKHFESSECIVLEVRDDQDYASLYYYTRVDIGDPSKIVANHNTIYFPTGKCFYVNNLKNISGVEEILLNK